ncbi:MAG: hypothetical protein HYU53_03860 [Acidobacteria bacterium]|nr:hypothetical protein [Acidobacteriota bacterium]
MGELRVAAFLAFKSVARGYRSTLLLMVAILSLTFVNALFVAGILNGMTNAIHRQVIDHFTSNLVIDPQETPVLLADEPTASLDTASAKVVLELLRTLNQELKQTIVMVTHELEDRRYVGRVVWLRDGLIDRVESAGYDAVAVK